MRKVPKVTLLVRRKIGGMWRHVRPQISVNGRIKTLPGDGSFSLRYKLRRKDEWEPVDGGADAALAAKARRELCFHAEAAGIPIPELQKASNRGWLSFEDAIKRYFSDEVPEEGELPEWNAATEKWRDRTRKSYGHSIALLRESCKKVYLQEVGRSDLLKFKVHLTRTSDRWGKLIADRTQNNYFSNVVSFLNAFHVTGLVRYSEFPTYEKRKVTIYGEEQIIRWLEAADLDERDVVIYYAGSGFRNGEGAHSEYADVNFELKEMEIFSKPECRYQTKDREHRIVTLSDEVIEMLRARQQRYPNSRLVFPNSRNNPDCHLLRIIKRVALRGGLNCGRCVGKTGRSCKDHPVC